MPLEVLAKAVREAPLAALGIAFMLGLVSPGAVADPLRYVRSLSLSPVILMTMSPSWLQPPLAPLRPGSYDFGRDMFFQGIGAPRSINSAAISSPPVPRLFNGAPDRWRLNS
jgi:hypothetical protein